MMEIILCTLFFIYVFSSRKIHKKELKLKDDKIHLIQDHNKESIDKLTKLYDAREKATNDKHEYIASFVKKISCITGYNTGFIDGQLNEGICNVTDAQLRVLEMENEVNEIINDRLS